MGTKIDAIAVVAGGRRRKHSARRLADDAARAALTAAGGSASDVDLLVNAGVYRDGNLGEPALAALIQQDIGANLGEVPVGHRGTFSFDVANGVCGVLTALQLADGLLACGTARRALVLASDAHPGRHLAPAFPFGATGAAAVCRWDDATEGFLGFAWRSFPEHEDLFRAELSFDGRHNTLIVEEHADFVARATACAAEVGAKLLADHGLTGDDVDAIVAAPLRPVFLTGIADALGVARSRVVVTESHGAHTAALLFAADALHSGDEWRAGRTVLFLAAGAGIAAGAALYRP